MKVKHKSCLLTSRHLVRCCGNDRWFSVMKKAQHEWYMFSLLLLWISHFRNCEMYAKIILKIWKSKDMRCHNNRMAGLTKYISNREGYYWTKYISTVSSLNDYYRRHTSWRGTQLFDNTDMIFRKSYRNDYSSHMSSWWGLFIRTCPGFCNVDSQ
jgi:hypothetical protein